MKFPNKFIRASIAGILAAGIITFSGCTPKSNAAPDLSGIKNVAELSALECYYHNVVKYHKDSDGWLFGLGSIGEKNMWFEYDGVVEMGVNIDQVSISEPDGNGVVTITLPPVQILGHPDIDTNSMTTPIEANGLFTSLSAADKNKALTDAQNSLTETANNDDHAKLQAKERAKSLLEQYVKNAGEAVGKTLTVKWEELDSE